LRPARKDPGPAADELEVAIQTARTPATASSASGADAVSRACGAAVESLPGEPSLLVAFTAGLDDDPGVAADIGAAAGGAPAVGMTGKGVFSANQPIDDGCAAVAFGDALQCGIGIGREAARDFRGAGLEAARGALDALLQQPSLLLLLVDSRAGDIAEAISGADAACGPDLPIAGGAASGQSPQLYANGEALEDAVVAIAIRSSKPFGIGSSHSCSVVGEPSVVTASDGQIIFEIDGREAETVYMERVGGSEPLSDESFEAMAITHPLARPGPRGTRLLRHVLGRVEGGGLLCSSQIPAGATVEFTVLSLDELVRTGRDSVRSSIEALCHEVPRAALVFDCAGRRRVLGHGQAEEVSGITRTLGQSLPFAGLYTNGEIARVHTPRGDHSHAVVTVSFA
jgi:hypothetical protein